MSSPGDCSDISERTPGEELIHVIFACPSTNETLISAGCRDKTVEQFRYSSIVNIQSHAQLQVSVTDASPTRAEIHSSEDNTAPVQRLDSECATTTQMHLFSTVDNIGAIAISSSDDVLSVTAVESSVDDAILTEVETTISDEDSATDLPSTADVYDDRVCTANETTSMMQSSSSDGNYGSSDGGVITPALTMSSILIKTRKPRRKGDKPLVKMMLTDPNQILGSHREGVIDYPEPTAEGLKKKNALESLKQAQSLFKFIPRGSTIAESSSSLKVCRGVKGNRQMTEAIASEGLPVQVNAEAVSSVPSDSSGNVVSKLLPPVTLGSEVALPASLRESDVVQEMHHVQREENKTCPGLTEKEVKPKIKQKLKEERKKHVTKVETISLESTAARQVIQAVISGENSTVSAVNPNAVVRPAASSSSKALEGSEEIQEKVHSKRKYTFQQPLVKRTSILRQNARLVVDTSDSDCGLGGGVDKIPPPGLTLVRSDSMETDSNSNIATDESAAPIEDEEQSPRAQIAHDDMDMGDSNTAPKTIRYEKKENVKRPGRGESKECSMTEVPGRHLLGPKMLAFMRAFPEGDVIGNDDVETSRTQRIRMESWLQALKGDGGIQSNIAKDADDDDTAELKDEIEKIKTDLLSGIEEKLIKAGGATGRGSGGSSVLLKPGMVQILLPYEIEILRARNAQQTIADDVALGSVRSPNDVPRCGVQTAASEMSSSYFNQWRLKTTATDKMSGYLNCTNTKDKAGRVWGYPSASTPNDSEESEHDTKVQVESDSSSSGRELLCSILGVVDAKVRTSNQLAQIHDTVRVKNAVEERRIKQFTGAGDVLSQRVHFLQTKHAAAEGARDQSQTESLTLISNMEIEEKELSDKLKRIRDDLASAKRTLGESVEIAKLARLSEKARIYFAAKESKKCGEMLTVAERNRELLSKFKVYITAITKSSTARAGAGAGHSRETQGDGEGQRAKVPRLEGTESERKSSKRISSNNSDSVNLMRKLSQWIEKSQSQSKESDASRTVLFTRLLYEGMRLSRHLLSKYATSPSKRDSKDKLIAVESTGVEESSDMDQFEKSFNMQDLYGEIQVESAVQCDVDSNTSDLQVATVDTSSEAAVSSVTTDAPCHLKPPCSEPLEVKKTVTVVLCDPRNLSHLVPRKMPERSIRIVKIMTKLTALQLALAEEKSEGIERTQALEERSLSIEAESTSAVVCSVPEVHNDTMSKDSVMISDALPLSAKEYDTKYGTYLDHLDHVGSYDETTPEEFSPRCESDFYERFARRRERLEELEIRCLARDESIALQDCFWESVALVHADEYIDHLRARARAASCFNPPYLPMKDHAITGQVEADVQFSSELNEDIPVDEADIRAAAEESGEPLPVAMLRRNARSSVRAGSCGSSQAQSYSNGHGAGYDDDSDAMGSSVKGRQRSATTSCNRLSIPQNVADALLAFREEDLTEDFAPNDSDRVWMWDTMRCRRVGGYAAPFFKNLRDCLSRNNHFLVYTGQDDKDGTPPIQWDIVQWLRQAVQPSASGEVFVSSCSSSRFDRVIVDFQGEYDEDRTKRRKGDDSFTGGIKAKVKENGSKQIVKSSKPALLSKSKLALAVSLAKRNALGHTVGDGLSDGLDVQHEVKHKINLGAFSAFRRISVWNNVRKVRVSGGNAPMKKDLKAFLEEKPEYVIWTGQRVAGADVDGDRRRVASKAKIIKKISSKLGKPRPVVDSQKSRFSALSRDAMKISASAAADRERADKDEKLDKLNLPKPLQDEIFNCITAPIRAKKEKKIFEASIFNPTPRRTGDRVRAKIGDYSADDDEGDRDADGECEEEGRVSLWNTVKQCRVAGGNAPYRKDLQEYLLNRPEYCVYDGQEPLVPRMMKAERDALKSGRGRGRGRGGRGGRGRGGRGASSGASASLPHVGDIKSDCIVDFNVLPISEPHLDSQVEFKTEKFAYPAIAKVTTVCSGLSGPVKQSKIFATALSLESKKKEKDIKLSNQILDSSTSSPIPLWNSRRKSCLSGRNAPIRSLLVKFLATRPEYEIYTGQDLHDNDDDELTRILALSIAGDDAPQLSYASERISMWDNVRLVKVEGEEAPMRCDLTAFIATNPERDVYINQEEMLQAARDRKLNSDSDSDESSVKRISKGTKAKSKVAQLLASIKLKEETIPADSTATSGEHNVSEGVDDSQTEDDNASSSSSQFAAFSSSSGYGPSHYGDDEDHDDGIARISETVPLKRGRKARAFKKGDLSMSSKSVKPLKKGHVSVWNKLRQCRVSGGNAPLRSQLTKFLATRPEYEVWVGQERSRKKKTPSESNGADGGEGAEEEGDEGVGETEGEVGERDGEGEGEIDGDEEGGEDEAHIRNVEIDDHEEEGDEDHELEEYDDVAATCSMMVSEEDQSSPPTSSAVSPTCIAPLDSIQSNLVSDVPMVLVSTEQQADEQPVASLTPAEHPEALLASVTGASARSEDQSSSPSMRRISRKRAMSADFTVSTILSPVRPSTPTPLTNSDTMGNDSVIAAAAVGTGNPQLKVAVPFQCASVLSEVAAASTIKTESGITAVSSLEGDSSRNMLALPADPLKSSYPLAAEALQLPDQLSLPGDTGNLTAACLDVREVRGVVGVPDNLAPAIIIEKKGDSDTASMDIVRPSIPDKGFVILPSRAKRRRELANLDDPTAPASSGTFGIEVEESPRPSGDAHLINGRAVVGDRFIVHCGEGNVVSGPGWWEDLDAGASDTYISPCSFDAAVAAAAVVCAGVDAVTLGCVLGCDLLATAKADENTEPSAFHTEEPILSGPSSPIRQHHDTDIVKDVARDLTLTEDNSQVYSAIAMTDPESMEVSSPLPNEGMGVEEISELMIGFLEECNSVIDNPPIEAASAICDISCAMEIESQEFPPEQAAQDSVRQDVVFIDLQQSVHVNGEPQSSVREEDHEGLPGPAATATGTEGEVRDRLDDYVQEATVPPTASISTHTRSKAGLVAAAGVVTPEMLGSVAADTPVTLTEVQGVKNVFCCIRPPGHHAGRFGSTRGCSNNGFCLLNNVAIGAYYARIKYGLRRFAVVDIDAHFGNGTAEIFEGDPHAFYSSVHLQYDGPKDYFFPSSSCCILGTEERHPNRVLVNVYPPVRAGNPLSKSGKRRSRGGFRSAFEDVIIPALRAFSPDIIFISAGFDGASTDPIGGQVGLKPIDFHWMAEKVQIVADEVCGGRVVSVLEGGYDVSKAADGLATCAEAHVLALAGRDYR